MSDQCVHRESLVDPETAAEVALQRRWVTAVVVVLLLVFGANQFATEWEMSRASAHPTSSAIDSPHYYVAAKLAGSSNPKAHQLYYPTHEDKEAVLDRIPSNTEWNQVAHENGLGDTLHFSTPPIVATLLVPFGKMPYQLAFMAWRVSAAGVCVVEPAPSCRPNWQDYPSLLHSRQSPDSSCAGMTEGRTSSYRRPLFESFHVERMRQVP